VRWGPSAWRQVKLLYWQRRCLNYTAPADQVVYEEDPTQAAKLLAGDPQFAAYPIARGSLRGEEDATNVNAAARIPDCWGKFTSVAGIAPMMRFGSAPGAIPFLHELVSPTGHRRLVAIRYFPDTHTFVSSPIAGHNYESTVLTPATLTRAPVPALRIYVLSVLSNFPRHAPNVRVYAGQFDPNDKAHFTIAYQMWGQNDVLDGRLDDKDDITLTARKLPVDE
jgi:hypothetical protein